MTSVQVALAEPQAITQAKSQADALRAQLDQLNTELEILVEKYDAANGQLAQTKADAAKNAAQLKQAQQDQAKAEGWLSARLVQIYKQGSGGAGLLDVLLGAGSWSDLMNRMSGLQRISGQDSKVVAQVTSYRAQVVGQQAKLAQDLKKQQGAAAQVQADKQAVTQKLAENKQLLKGKEAQIAQLQQEEQARQAKLAAQAKEAARQAALKQATLQAQRARAADQQAALRARVAPSLAGNLTPTSVPVSGSGARVVQTALKYLGVPYVWAGASPGGFDCSGLVMYVYAQLGVSLPHSSAAQYNCGTHVSRDQLVPGDLVFYGSPIHHVGIYVGNGNMIDAPYTGVSVRIDPLQSDYAGATRIL